MELLSDLSHSRVRTLGCLSTDSHPSLMEGYQLLAFGPVLYLSLAQEHPQVENHVVAEESQ